MSLIGRSLFALAGGLLSGSAATAEVITLACAFPTYANKEGVHPSKGFALRFITDTETGKSYATGDGTSSEVELVDNAGGFTFVETTGSGNVMTTTVTKTGDAVHSRATIMLAEIIPSQYYGTCRRK